jgi:phage terminase large subunit-like protein
LAELKLERLQTLKRLQDEVAARRLLEGRQRWPSPLSMAAELDRTIVRTPALNEIDRRLVALANSPRAGRLATFVSPQEGKSTLCSYWHPLWLLVRDPSLRIIIVSYSDETARRWGADVKMALETFNGDEGTVDLGLRLREDSRAAGRWQVAGERGGVYCVGVGGSITGRAADCLVGSTRIVTDCGYLTIKELCERVAGRPLVLSYNHRLGRTEWRRIVACRILTGKPVVEVITGSGRVVRCTPDHRFFTVDGGYVAAADLAPGMGLLTTDGRAGTMLELREGLHQTPFRTMAGEAARQDVLFEGVPERHGDRGADVRRVRQGISAASPRSDEGGSVHSLLLHETMLPGHGDGRRARTLGDFTGHPQVRGTVRLGNFCGTSESVRSAPLLRQQRYGTVGRDAPPAAMRRVRRGTQGESSDLPQVLQRGTGVHLPGPVVLVLRGRVYPDAGRTRKAAAEGSDELLLLARLCRQVAQGPWPAVHEMRQADRLQGSRSALLLQGLPTVRQSGGQGSGVRAVRTAFLPEDISIAVLRSSMRRRSPLSADHGRKQPSLQGRDKLQPTLSPDAPRDSGAGPRAVSGMPDARQDGPYGAQDRRAHEVSPCSPPFERDSLGQPSGELDPLVSAVPHGSPQVGYDTVSMVRELHGVRDSVYDIQVEGNSNFFADEVLVHNCIIVDDPLKSLEEAQSAKYRDRGMRTWQGVLIPRMAPATKVVWVQTLWHESEPIQQILANEGADWEVVRIPAICDSPDDPLGRLIGEPMVSARGERDWQKIRRDVGEYVFAALYQQRPSPAEGGLFKRLWWRYWSPAPPLANGERLDLAGRVFDLRDCWRFITGDLAASTRTSADFTVAAAWAMTFDGDLVLLDYNRARIGEANHFDLFRPLAQRWAVDTAFVEATQHSMTLTAEATRSGLHVTPLKADVDKFSRALPYSARCSGGRVWLPAGAPEKTGIWVDEHAAFPNGSHDDLVDTGAYATRVAITGWQPTQPKPYVPQRHGEPMLSPFGDRPIADFMSVPL